MNQQRNVPSQQAITLASKQNLQTLLAKPNVGLTIERGATKWLSAEQIKIQAAIAVSRNPSLLKCTQASFLESMVRAAELGLRFAGAGGEAYLVPYRSCCTLIIGYRGLCILARRTGMIMRIEARVVHEKDVFEVGYGTGQTLVHRPRCAVRRFCDGCASICPSLPPSKTFWRSRRLSTTIRRRIRSRRVGTSRPRSSLRAWTLRRARSWGTSARHTSMTPGSKAPPAWPTNSLERPRARIGTFRVLGNQPANFAAQKRSLLAQIQDEMNVRYPDDGSIARQTARLDVLKHVFGSPDPNKIGHLPLMSSRPGWRT